MTPADEQAREIAGRLSEGEQCVAWLREWSKSRPSDGMIERQHLSKRDQTIMTAVLAGAADTIELRLAALREMQGETK